jgi:prepilin-type N-terminal cleavage/methylation domain-containing protein
MQRTISKMRSHKGFTLVELAVVIVIIGVLAAFGVPKFLQSVEKSKAAEAFNYWATVQSAQERYIAQNGVYWVSSGATDTLDTELPILQYFTATGGITANPGSAGTPTWSGTLVRKQSSYGLYTVSWNQDGFDKANSNIPQPISPVTGDVGSGS